MSTTLYTVFAYWIYNITGREYADVIGEVYDESEVDDLTAKYIATYKQVDGRTVDDFGNVLLRVVSHKNELKEEQEVEN